LAHSIMRPAWDDNDREDSAAVRRVAWFCLILSAGLLMAFGSAAAKQPSPPAQTTVTSTPPGTTILVPGDFVNVRSGPGTSPYEQNGVLLQGQVAPALGRSVGGDWIQIQYPGVPGNVGWVYANLVLLQGQGFLPIVEPPPTPTPQITATINPTLAAQFNLLNVTPTRLPTFTPAAPVVQPTLAPPESADHSGFPPVIAIMGLLVLGLFGTVLSFLRGS
jgi:hypothetical protein